MAWAIRVIALFQLQTDLDLSIDPMVKSEISEVSNTLKSMGQPNVLYTGHSKPILELTGKDQWQRST